MPADTAGASIANWYQRRLHPILASLDSISHNEIADFLSVAPFDRVATGALKRPRRWRDASPRDQQPG